MVNISLLDLRVVKEKSGRYDIAKKIKNPTAIYELAIKVLEMDTLAEEQLALITLDTKGICTGVFVVSRGTLNSSLIHPREIFKRALMQNASSIALMHNHPSGDTTASTEDIEVTKRIIKAGEIIGIQLLDHVIVGDNNYSSMKEDHLI